MAFSCQVLASDILLSELSNINLCSTSECYFKNAPSIEEITETLQQHADTLSQDLIATVTTILKCSDNSTLAYNPILTIIDYSLPSDKKRFWVFDLAEKKLLHHTYVSHGIKSGLSAPRFFSNKNRSKASSIGVFLTGESYRGRYGLGLRLQGLEEGINDSAESRAIVIHPVWYVNETFIKNYGRLGRSWGCPALPLTKTQTIIDTIKDQSLLVVYYPSKKWLQKSDYLSCKDVSLANNIDRVESMPKAAAKETRDAILYADNNGNNRHELSEPILVMSAENYQRIFKKRAPLSRMLRRQIKLKEYIALNQAELQQLDTNIDKVINGEDIEGLRWVDFVIEHVKKLEGGFWATEFKSVNIGKSKEVQLTQDTPVLKTTRSNTKLKSTNKFIRWLGL